MHNDKNFSSELLSAKIDSLKKERDELFNLLERKKKIVEDLHEYWGGDNGDEAYERLTKHSKDFDSKYLESYDKRIEFLNEVIANYLELDTGSKDIIDESANIKA